jgi:nitroimidazol reductase NimA-like FMN-containing flavoprotein (pyridoxamine 5'-phosphate oxidase superfamily)
MEYESVTGGGSIEILSDEKKTNALDHIVKQYTDRADINYCESLLKAVTVLKLTVENITCKRLKK